MITSVFQWMNAMDRQYRNRVAFRVYEEEKDCVKEISYSEYIADLKKSCSFVKKCSNTMELPYGNKHVGILCNTSYESVVGVFGALLANVVAVPLNGGKTFEELEYEITNGEVELLLYDKAFAEMAEKCEKLLSVPCVLLDEFQNCKPGGCSECEDENALAMILYTSGTTARSKGVMLSQKNFFAAIETFCKPFDLFKRLFQDAEYIFSSFLMLPFYHISGLTSVYSWGYTGNTVNLCENPKYFFRDYEKMGGDYIAAVPSMVKLIINEFKKGERNRLKNLRIVSCSSAMIDAEQLQFFVENGVFVLQMYGMTETSGSGAYNMSQEAQRCDSVGTICSDCELKIIDGEICLRGDGIMLGYYHDAMTTQKTIIDGWLHTGDLGYCDWDGYLYLTGRKKNVIILSGGENVSPEELELALMRNENVTEARISQVGDSICAEIFCDSDKKQAVEEHVENINSRNPLYKRISKVVFVEQAFEKTTSGKMKRV